MNVRDDVLKHLAAIIKEHSPESLPESFTDEMRLDEFWLDSVAYVTLISRLEKAVGYIPPPILEGTLYPNTIEELVAMYEDAAPRTA